MYQLQENIANALMVADKPQLRKQAEDNIIKLLMNNPSEFFIKCSQIIVDENKKDTLRQSTATVMKALLVKKDNNGGFYWDWIQPNNKLSIKQALLSTLVSPNEIIMKAGANAIAQIAAIQIPRNQWLQILSVLASNVNHQQYNIKKASITTIGFICQQLRGVKSNINAQGCQQILGCILYGMNQQKLDIQQKSVLALRNSICFLTSTLENQQYCQKLLEYLLPLFQTSFKRNVYEVLFQLGKYCYHMLFLINANYLNKVVQASILHIQQRQQISMSALQFWDTLGQQYLKRMEDSKKRINSAQPINIINILQKYHHIVLPQVMASIIIMTKKDLDFIQLRQVAVKTLSTFVQCCDREIIDKITDGVSRVISSPQAGQRQASVLLFSCLSNYADRDYIQNCFRNGFAHLYQLINDNEKIVKKNSLNGFLTLSQIFPEVFLQNDLSAMFDHLLGFSTYNDEEIFLLSSGILANMTDKLKDFTHCKIYQQPSQFLQKIVPIFINNLQTGNISKNQKLILSLLNITMNTTKRDVLIHLTSYLIEQYDIFANSNVNNRQMILQQVITGLHTCVLAMAPFTIPSQIKEKIYGIIDKHMAINGIEAQGINMIGGAAMCFKKEFLQKLDKYWHAIMSGLSCDQSPVIFRASLSCISDISRTFQGTLASRLIGVFEQLLKYMHQNIDRDLKCQILKCFGDVCLGLKDYGQKYIQKLIQISQTCFQAVYQLSEIENQQQYAQQLKQSLIDMYHCVVFTQHEGAKLNTKLADHFPLISTFIVKTCDVKYKPTVDYLRNCLYLIFDSALFYSKNTNYKNIIQNVLSSNQIQNLINLAQKYANNPQMFQLLKFVKQKSKMIKK